MGFIRNNNVWKINKILAGISGGVSPEDVQDMIDTSITPIETEIEGKQDTLTAGDNITISSENVISADVPEYTAGDGISINADNVISVTSVPSDFTIYNKINYTDSTDGFIELSGTYPNEIMTFKKDVRFVVCWSDGTLHRSETFIPKGSTVRQTFSLIPACANGGLYVPFISVDRLGQSSINCNYYASVKLDNNNDVEVNLNVGLSQYITKRIGSITSENTGIWVYVRD